MKELTSVLTLQLTFIADFDDETAEEMMATKDQRAKQFVKRIQYDCISECDDIQVLDHKIFVLDKED